MTDKDRLKRKEESLKILNMYIELLELNSLDNFVKLLEQRHNEIIEIIEKVDETSNFTSIALFELGNINFLLEIINKSLEATLIKPIMSVGDLSSLDDFEKMAKDRVLKIMKNTRQKVIDLDVIERTKQ